MAAGRYSGFEAWAQTKGGPTTTISFSGSSARNATALAAALYRLGSTEYCHYRQGDNSVTATVLDAPLFFGTIEYHLVSAFERSDTAIEGPDDRYFAAIRDTDDGILFITNTSELS